MNEKNKIDYDNIFDRLRFRLDFLLDLGYIFDHFLDYNLYFVVFLPNSDGKNVNFLIYTLHWIFKITLHFIVI
jgi:hypothetical protein